MKTRRQLLDNKGAALVTILIAVTFMTIMASSLMYMAYMNYLTKSMRYSSTDNFYTDEFALDELATTLQQTAAGTSGMDAARTAVKTAIGATTEGSFDTYTPGDVTNLITLAKQEAGIADITVEISPRLKDDTGHLKEHALYITSDMIKLCGVQITVTTTEGYVSTITSDIEINFPNTMPGTIDINDFSIITESRFDMSNGGSRVCSGNVFIQNYGGSGPALKIGNSGSLVLLSPQAMVVGDIVIDDHSELHITGTCTVYGSITVKNGSALIVSGDLKHEGAVNVESGSTLIGVTDTNPQTVGRSSYLDNGLVTTSIFKPVMIYGKFNNFGGTEFTKASLMDVCGADQPMPGGGTFSTGTGNIQYKAEDSTTHARAVVYGRGQGSNFHSEGNSLILVCIDVNITSGMNFENTTVLTMGEITYNHMQGTAYMTKMRDEDYEAAKNLLFYTCESWNLGNEHQIDLRPNDSTYSGANFKARWAGGTVDDKATVQSNASSFKLPASDGERTFVADSSGVNYLPVGYFINENSSEVMTDVYAAPTGAADPKNSTVTYRVWSKD